MNYLLEMFKKDNNLTGKEAENYYIIKEYNEIFYSILNIYLTIHKTKIVTDNIWESVVRLTKKYDTSQMLQTYYWLKWNKISNIEV